MTDTVLPSLLVSVLAFLVGFAMLVPVRWHRDSHPALAWDIRGPSPLETVLNTCASDFSLRRLVCRWLGWS
jgi:ABC-type cobalamin transport system permease subunit